MSGGIIVFGDLQAEYSNLDRCEKVLDQGLVFAKKRKASAAVFLGDLKNSYNPVDTRVTNFVTAILASFVTNAVETFVLLGNHDRIGMYSDTESWLDTLKHTGAQVCSEPRVCQVGTRYSLFMLPYRSSIEETKKAVKTLALSTGIGKRILCFHQDLKEASYNGSLKSQALLSLNDLSPESYHYVLGGHIHGHQQLTTNVWYVGSLFACDWGEANSEKYFCYVE